MKDKSKVLTRAIAIFSLPTFSVGAMFTVDDRTNLLIIGGFIFLLILLLFFLLTSKRFLNFLKEVSKLF